MNYARFSEKNVFDSSAFGPRLKPYVRESCADVVGACYIVCDDEGKLSYIGKSSKKGMRGRIDAHSEKRWFGCAFYIETNDLSPETSADRLERALIRTFKPYANRQLYPASGISKSDALILRKYEISCEIISDESEDVVIPEPIARACNSQRNPLARWKEDKPGDLSMRYAKFYGEVA